MADFSDGLDNTIMVLELPDRAAPWTKPQDIVVPFSQAKTTGGSERENDGVVVNALFGDGSVRGLTRTSLDSASRSALTRAAGDEFDRKVLRQPVEHVP
jgi:prepilin-type processing-associated H-X9-DG protein